jgi:hypothetical protein
MGAVEYEGEPFLFFKRSDGSLWLYTELPFFSWTDLGTPPKKGVKLGSSMGAIAYEGTTPDEGSIFVYVKAEDGNLWLNTWNPVRGSDWKNLGVPTVVKKECKCNCSCGKKNRRCKKRCIKCKRDCKKAKKTEPDAIESSNGVVLDAAGVPSCFVKSSDGIIWENKNDVWSIAEAA